MSEECWTLRASRAAAKKVKFPEDKWFGWIFSVADQGGIFITGAVCPPITRGPRKGEPNYRKHDRTTKRTVYLAVGEY
jgi:hypothetical protein